MRAGLDVNLRMSDSWSFNINSYLTTLGTAFSGQSHFILVAAFLFHWDDAGPCWPTCCDDALEANARESCDDIEARFIECSRPC